MVTLTVSEVYQQAEKLTKTSEQLTVRGWVRVHRTSGGEDSRIHFIWFSDGSTIKDIQAVYSGELAKIDYLASIEVVGKLIPSPASGQAWEIEATSVTVVGPCPPRTFPLPRKKLEMQFLRQHPHLRMRTRKMQAIMRIRHQAWMSVLSFFHERDFISLHTPLITGSDCEGAGEAFRVDGGKGFFPKPAYLTVSGQLEGEMGATAMGRVFTCGPTFRAEHSDTPRHLAEFWMVEPEMAWFDLDDTITLGEDLIKYCVEDCKKYCADELAVLEHKLHLPDFKRITYTEAVEVIRQHPCKFDTLPEWGDDLGTAYERFLSDDHFKAPVVITHYPREMKAFYMHQEPGGKTVACFDLLLPGIGEAIGGSQREVRLDVLEKEMVSRGLDTKLYSKYLDLRRFGSVPHSGFGLGFERLVRYLTGIEHIRDVIPFPVYYRHLS